MLGPVVAGLAACGLTTVQLVSRFGQRRPLSTGRSRSLIAAISLLAGLLASLLATEESVGWGIVGLGASYPFWAPNPAAPRGGKNKTDTEEETDTEENGDQSLNFITNAVWLVAGFLTNRLDDHLSSVKKRHCDQIVSEIDDGYAGDIPAFEPVARWLGEWASAHTDSERREQLENQVAGAYTRAKASPTPLPVLINLAYDWRVEGEIRDMCLSTPPPPLHRRGNG